MLEAPPTYTSPDRLASALHSCALEILTNLRSALIRTEFQILAAGGFSGRIFASQRELSSRLDLVRMNLETALLAFGLHDEERP